MSKCNLLWLYPLVAVVVGHKERVRLMVAIAGDNT
jgi:hypothetical protein